jgi:hypothetical protein
MRSTRAESSHFDRNHVALPDVVSIVAQSPTPITLSTRLSSPRLQRKLLWFGGGVLIAGVVFAGITFFWTGPKAKPVPLSNRPAQIAPKSKTVPLEPGAKVVGERFIETAVARKNLAESWKLTAPALRDGFTLTKWKTGAIPVVPYPADTSKPSPVKVDYSYKNRALLLILLVPRKGIVMKPQLFLLGVHAFGQGPKRHWLVDYWAPYGAPKIPQG